MVGSLRFDEMNEPLIPWLACFVFGQGKRDDLDPVRKADLGLAGIVVA